MWFCVQNSELKSCHLQFDSVSDGSSDQSFMLIIRQVEDGNLCYLLLENCGECQIVDSSDDSEILETVEDTYAVNALSDVPAIHLLIAARPGHLFLSKWLTISLTSLSCVQRASSSAASCKLYSRSTSDVNGGQQRPWSGSLFANQHIMRESTPLWENHSASMIFARDHAFSLDCISHLSRWQKVIPIHKYFSRFLIILQFHSIVVWTITL